MLDSTVSGRWQLIADQLFAAPKNHIGLFQTKVMLLLKIMLIYDEHWLKDHLPSPQAGLKINFFLITKPLGQWA